MSNTNSEGKPYLFTTDSLNLSAFLLTSGASILEVIEDSPNHFSFVFNDFQLCKQLEISYLNKATVPAKQLLDSRHEVVLLMKKREGLGR